jgi:RNA methyltransferase, TrmH family
MPRITSSDNPRLKQAARLLASSRDRRKAGLCVLEGAHLVGVYLDRHGPLETVIVLDTAMDSTAHRALLRRIPASRVLAVSAAAWTEFSQLPADVAVLGVVPAPNPAVGRIADFCLLLEQVQDPGNVGSILRSAAAAGVEQVFMSPGCAFAWSPKVLRAGQGGHFHLEIFEDVDLLAWVKKFHGASVAAVPSGGDSLFAANFRGPIAIAVGNEGAGLSAPLCAAATHRVTLPMPGNFESLNAAAAAAVFLFECVRARLSAAPPRTLHPPDSRRRR